MGIRSSLFRRALSGGSRKNKYIPRRDLAITQSITFFGEDGSKFYEDIWEELYTEIIEAQQEKAGNAGQETLLSDDYFGRSAKRYCQLNGEDYNPDAFVTYVRTDLGDDYYNAISIIIDECAEELIEAWDRATSNDNVGEKLFGFSGGNRVYGNFSNALANYTAAATARGYNFSGSAAGNARNRELNRQSLIKRFGTGPTKAWNTSNYYASASYVNAAKKNGKNL